VENTSVQQQADRVNHLWIATPAPSSLCLMVLMGIVTVSRLANCQRAAIVRLLRLRSQPAVSPAAKSASIQWLRTEEFHLLSPQKDSLIIHQMLLDLESTTAGHGTTMLMPAAATKAVPRSQTHSRPIPGKRAKVSSRIQCASSAICEHNRFH